MGHGEGGLSGGKTIPRNPLRGRGNNVEHMNMPSFQRHHHQKLTEGNHGLTK